MTSYIISVEEDTTAEEVVSLMLRHHVKRLPVTRDGRMIGIISRADIVRRVGDMIEPGAATVDDAAIERTIMSNLARESWAPRTGASVAVTGGVVHPEGCLTDAREREAMGVVAENIAGVKRVENRVFCIEPQFGTVTFDPDDPVSTHG